MSMNELFECIPSVIMTWIASVVSNPGDITSILIGKEVLDAGVTNEGYAKKVPGPHTTYTVKCKSGETFTQVFKRLDTGEWEKV